MTDETMEQIKRDATVYAAKGETIKACVNCGCHEDQNCKWGGSEYDCDYVSHDIPDVFSPLRQRTLNAFTDGATAQHPIAHAEGVKEGRRQAIEEAIIEVEQVAREVVETQRDYSIIRSVKKELEKLKL